MQEVRTYVLCIGGFDPSAGAGVLADIKTFEQLKVLGLAVITCNTLQTEDQFVRMEWLRTEDILRAVKIMMERYPIDFVKIGVVRNADMLNQIVSAILTMNSECKIVWDTVFGSTSGFDFFDLRSVENLLDILSKLFLITPNAIEYDILKRLGLINHETSHQLSILRKGGHDNTQLGIDVLYAHNTMIELGFDSERLPQKHGSGCVLASAITGYLALGHKIQDACLEGKEYITRFLKSNNTLLGYHNE